MVDIYSKYRIQDLKRKVEKIGVYPLDVMVTGITGAGKSTTLNAFFQSGVASVGDGVDPKTMQIDAYSLNKVFRLWDTPGLGDGTAKDEQHKKRIVDLLHKTYFSNEEEFGFIDMVIVILDAGSRDLGTTYKLLNNIIIPNISASRIFIALNQCDMGMKGRYWNRRLNRPETQLIDALEEKVVATQNRIFEATGVRVRRPVYYSAEYSYNIDKLFDFIIDNAPLEKRKLR